MVWGGLLAAGCVLSSVGTDYGDLFGVDLVVWGGLLAPGWLLAGLLSKTGAGGVLGSKLVVSKSGPGLVT